MNKKEQLLKQAQELIKKAKEIEMQERQKVGKLVLSMYEKDEIKDTELRQAIASIVGDMGSAIHTKSVNTNEASI